MKFGKYFKSQQIIEWQDYYIDYKLLKKIINTEKTNEFEAVLDDNLKKLNWFFNQFSNDFKLNNIDKIQKFLVLNYMAIFKSIKKHDKRCCKNLKIHFFNWISQESFYNYYINLPRIKKNVELIIFDKDGTLILLHKIFSKWVETLSKKYIELGVDVEIFFKELGYNKETKKFLSNSIVAKGTNDDIRNCIYNILLKNNDITSDLGSLKELVNINWEDIELSTDDIEECGNTLELFKYLKENNIKIAICTSDDREPTLLTIDYLNINSYLDYIICGDDPISNKPSPEPIWDICNNLNVDVSNTIMIGDTISDIHAGLNAKCSFVIGVLSGGYAENELSDADMIINSIDDIPSLFNKNLIN